MKATIYNRSVTNDKEILAEQEAVCPEYAKANGFSIMNVKSATQTDALSVRFARDMLAAIAQLDSDLRGERIKQGLRKSKGNRLLCRK